VLSGLRNREEHPTLPLHRNIAGVFISFVAHGGYDSRLPSQAVASTVAVPRPIFISRHAEDGMLSWPECVMCLYLELLDGGACSID